MGIVLCVGKDEGPAVAEGATVGLVVGPAEGVAVAVGFAVAFEPM